MSERKSIKRRIKMAGELTFIPVQILVISGRKSSLILYKILKSWMNLQRRECVPNPCLTLFIGQCNTIKRPIFDERIFDGNLSCELYFLFCSMNNVYSYFRKACSSGHPNTKVPNFNQFLTGLLKKEVQKE